VDIEQQLGLCNKSEEGGDVIAEKGTHEQGNEESI
jgi:hypothetical protein